MKTNKIGALTSILVNMAKENPNLYVEHHQTGRPTFLGSECYPDVSPMSDGLKTRIPRLYHLDRKHKYAFRRFALLVSRVDALKNPDVYRWCMHHLGRASRKPNTRSAVLHIERCARVLGKRLGVSPDEVGIEPRQLGKYAHAMNGIMESNLTHSEKLKFVSKMSGLSYYASIEDQ